MSKEIIVDDAELELLMAELEDQNEAMMAPIVAPVSKEPEAKSDAVILDDGEAMPTPTGPKKPKVETVKSMVESSEKILAEIEAEKLEKPIPVKVVAVTPTEPEIAPPTLEPKRAPLAYYVDASEFNEAARISEVELDRCMIEQNALRAYYGVLAAKAEAQATRVKNRFEVLEATLYNDVRGKLSGLDAKVTEKMIDNAIKIDPRWLKGKNLLAEAEEIAQTNKILAESLRDRASMLVQLGADRRDDFKGEMRTLSKQSDRDDLRERALAVGRKAS